MASRSVFKQLTGWGRSERQRQGEALKEQLGATTPRRSEVEAALSTAVARSRWRHATHDIQAVQDVQKHVAPLLKDCGMSLQVDAARGVRGLVKLRSDAQDAIEAARLTQVRRVAIARSALEEDVRQARSALNDTEAAAVIAALAPVHAGGLDAAVSKGLRLFWETCTGACFINGHARYLAGTQADAPAPLRLEAQRRARDELTGRQGDRTVVLDALNRGPAFEKAMAFLQSLGTDSRSIVSAMREAVASQPSSTVQTLY
ncbi:hypothetical protein [Stenotrophomonas sp. NPDC077659]|uniref:hypothetical protein n=1 Tax=Stenotrophomonas sp. NPDC077659 TaxID=3390694 RepID=UPI003D022C4C